MRDEIIVKKLLKYINKAIDYSRGLSYDEFVANDMLLEASVFNLSQIGELTKHLTEDFTATHNDIPWRQMYGLRNKIVHDYDGVNLKLIWEIIESDLPPLKEKLLELKL